MGQSEGGIEAHDGKAAEYLSAVDEAAFALHLDDGGSSDGTFSDSLRGALLGYPGSPDGPRWFDKSFSVAVTRDGVCAQLVLNTRGAMECA